MRNKKKSNKTMESSMEQNAPYAQNTADIQDASETRNAVDVQDASDFQNAADVQVAPDAQNVPDVQNTLNSMSAFDTKNTLKSKKSRKKLFSRKTEDQIIRIEKLEKIMAEHGDDIDVDAIVSMYMPQRKAKRLGAALLRLDKMRIALLLLVLVVCILFIMAFMQEKMGNFTINLNRLELYRKGIAIADTGNFDKPTARLSVNTVKDATNITMSDLPDNLDEIDGDHNGRNYMAYTYYVRNAGKEDVSYVANITLDSCSKGAEEAVRVAVWRNGERIVYAMPARDGSNEENCENFLSGELVCSYTEENFLVGNVDKYTIVIWMEGEDPECVDAIVGGSVEFSMTIDALDDDNTSLLVKFIQDIKDTLTNDKPISAAGNEAPDYYNSGEITWENRRNQ